MRTKNRPPLFIPLKTKFYEAFDSGEKTTEYRAYGPRWNFNNVWVGRPVIISKGYGKKQRRSGEVTAVLKYWATDLLPADVYKDLQEIYGGENFEVLAIEINLDVRLVEKGTDS